MQRGSRPQPNFIQIVKSRLQLPFPQRFGKVDPLPEAISPLLFSKTAVTPRFKPPIAVHYTA
jgi:hypothetical protein